MTKLKQRNEISDKFKWDLSPLTKSDEEWEMRYKAALKKVDDIKKYNGLLSQSGDVLLNCFKETSELEEEIGKLFVYANLKHDENTINPTYQALSSKASTLYVSYSTATSFISPEIISIGKEAINKFTKENKELEVYAHFFDDLFREADHILSLDKEQILAMAQEISAAPSSIFSMVNNADIKFAPAKNSDNESVEVTHGQFINLLQSKDRVLRKSAYETYYNSFIAQKNTIAETYNYSVKKDIFYSKVRNYPSALQASLSSNNISVSIYKNLIKTVNDNLHLFHEYVGLRKKILKLNKQHMYDIYVPLIIDADQQIDYETAKSTIVKALQPLGGEYIEILSRAFNESWIDVYENQNKRSGAYSWGTYGANPFILMNYTNKVNDMFTLAHEMGHALHSYYTCSEQPFIYGNYTIFLAEIASTVNESLLINYLLKTTQDKTMYNYLINYFIEQFRGTLFRQTMFAEFELITHEKLEANEPLTSDILNEIYKDLIIKYFGDSVELDERIPYEWSRIPHFYNPFYVYQYATGFSAAIAISKQILEEGDVARERYIDLLKSGSSNYSIDILKKAGLDMTSSKPIEDAMSVFAELLNKLRDSLNIK